MSPVKKRTVKRKIDPVVENMHKRNRLAELLTIAAQIEHDVMVQYLFAAASLKKTVAEGGVTYDQLELMRKWSTDMMMVARQEMEHLGIASNLLTAIGEAPIFRRPAFPMSTKEFPLHEPSTLDAFSAKTALRFVCYEMPNKLNSAHTKYLKSHIKNFTPKKYDGIYRVYSEIERLFEQIDETDLFIGPPSAQFYSGGNSVLRSGMVRGMVYPQPNQTAQTPIYDVSMTPVADLSSAKKAIQQIIEEGEGANENSTTSHFARFLQMHMELTDALKKDRKFTPARQVVSNPRVPPPDGGPIIKGVTYITNKDTIKVMEVFDQAYSTMLLMLIRYFAHTDETTDDLVGLQNTVFFPMMTIGIRPLTEVLTQLPAHGTNSPLRAGPSFVIPKSVQFLPHRESAWRVILGELQLLTKMAEELTTIRTFPQPIQERLQFTHENFARMTINFKNAIQARKMK